MTSMSAPAAGEHVTLPRRWRAIAGATGVVAGAVIVAGAFLPWVETFTGLISIPGVRGSYGRILAAMGAGIAVAGLWHVIRGSRWPRWLAGLGGFAAAGFAGYLLVQLAATTKSLGADSMVLARGGPGLWVAAAGALLAVATLFLPMSAVTAAGDGPGGRPRRGQTPAGQAQAGQAQAGRLLAGWAAAGRALAGEGRLGRLWTAVLSRAGDLTSAGPRRRLQIALGLVWLADAALQFQPYMFTRPFASQMLTPAAAGNPAFLASPALWATRLIGHDVPAWNSSFALLQMAIAAGLLWRPTVRAALAASTAWSLGVWWIGEGLGGVLTGTASPVTGAPGAVILYGLLAVLAWPTCGTRPGPGDLAAASPLRRHGSRAAWLVLWASSGYLVLQPAVRAPRALAGALAAGAAGEPGWLAAADRWAASAVGSHGLAVAVLLAVLFVLVAAGIFLRATTRPALVLAVVLAVAVWVIGENFGEILTGMGTDPDTGPLLVLLAAAFWPLRPAAGAARAGRVRPVAATRPAVRGRSGRPGL
ncbi:MAG TPA: hypothetical protein VGM53_03875 [Streptosporangiaceae bacterium]